MDQTSSRSTPAAELSVHEAPPFAWSFEETPFSLKLRNRGLSALADPGTVTGVRYTADVFRAGEFVRRVAIAPLDGPVAVGETRVFSANLGITVIGGEFELRFGLERDGAAGPEVLPVAAIPAPLRVRNQIMEAFVELINACNFKCTFCPQPGLRREQKPMDFALATKVVRDLADYGYHHPIRCHLLGEPLLYKRFFDFVDMAHDLGQRVFLLTNGSRFREPTIERIFESRLDEMLISLNTPEEELYEAQRGTSVPYSKYMAGIRRMVAEIARRGPPPATIINVLFDADRRDDPAEIARVNRIVNEWVNVVREAEGRKPLPAGEANPMARAERDRTRADIWAKIPIAAGLEVQLTPYHTWGEGLSRGEHFCAFPWQQLAILVDGTATVCCVDAEGEINVGNAREQTVEEIWNGPTVNRIREGFWNRLQAVHPRCVRCPVRHWDIAERYRNHPMDPPRSGSAG